MKKVITNKKNVFVVQIGFAMILAGMYGSGFPMALFDVTIAGEFVSPQLNMLIVSVVAIGAYSWLFPGYKFQLHKKGIKKGIITYGGGMILGTIIMIVNTCYESYPLNLKPSWWHVMAQCILFFFLVGLVEEVLLRGCVFQSLLQRVGDNKRGVIGAILISSLLFSLMHLVGAPEDLTQLIMKLCWTFCGGVAFSILYYLSKNLWCGIFLHWLMDITVLPTFFSSTATEDTGAIGTLVASCIMMVIAIVMLYRKMNNNSKKVENIGIPM